MKIQYRLKNSFVGFLWLILLSACANLPLPEGVSNVASNETAERDSRYQQLLADAKYAAFALKYPNLANSFILYNASIAAMQQNNVADAFFFYEAANARAAYDLETCLPTPAEAQQNLTQLFEKADKSLDVFASDYNIDVVVNRFQLWPLVTGPGYDSGWTCRYKVLQEDKVKVAARIKKTKLDILNKVATLMNDEQYVFAVRNVMQYLKLPPQQQTLILQNQYKTNKRLIIAKEAQAGTGLIGSKLP